MLSKIIKDRIRSKYKHTIRYPKDCTGLSAHMQSICKTKVSASTLKRLFGFIEGTETLRAATKDCIAIYLGFKTWEELQDDILGRKTKRVPVITALEVSSLSSNQVVKLRFGRISFIKLLYKGKNKFAVLEQANTKINVEDEFELTEVKLDYPLLITSVKKKGVQVRELLLGELTGVTEIELITKTKKENGKGSVLNMNHQS